MPEYLIVLYDELSSLTRSKSVQIEANGEEIDGENLKRQLEVVLEARNPPQANDIKEKIRNSDLTSSDEVIPDSNKLAQGHYGLRPRRGG